MTLSLENLSSGFSKQYDELCKCRMPYGFKVSCLYVFSVGDSQVQVTSKMKRQVHQVPFIERGGELCNNKVIVFVNPPNEKIEQAVASHFKSLMIPPTRLGLPEERVFGEITINRNRIM